MTPPERRNVPGQDSNDSNGEAPGNRPDTDLTHDASMLSRHSQATGAFIGLAAGKGSRIQAIGW